MSYLNRDIRGEYLACNYGHLYKRIPRGENIEFIANYIFANPGCRPNECRKALLQWRGYRQCDKSRGQYASYFYDRYHYKWYHHKIWNFIVDENGKKRMVLNIGGMQLVDSDFQKRLKDWKGEPRTDLFSKKT